ncbi:MAG: hypothetical protein K0S32_2479 [Bacteroidetes bacterium]|jgi:hypothetical protein|nr:hypothetical protein [Bacteroidota bacterium]
MSLTERIEEIEKLGSSIFKDCNGKNEYAIIDRYNSWRIKAEDLFCEFFDESNNHYKDFVNFPRGGNGYVLSTYFSVQYPISQSLLSKIKNKDLPTKNIKTVSKNKECSIFISHSSKDHDLVRKFVEHILILGLGIKREKIFCTSIEGQGIRSGDDFKKKVIEELSNAKAVIQIITKNYKASDICLNEMGAAWVMDTIVIPVVADPFDYDVGFIHANTQQLKLNKESDLFKLYDDHKDSLFHEKVNVTNYSVQIKSFLDFIAKYGDRKEAVNEAYFFYGVKNTIYGELNLSLFGHPLMEKFEDSASFHEYLFLELDPPIDILPSFDSRFSEPENTACFGVTRMHVFDPEGVSKEELKKLVGKRVAVTGDFMIGHTQWHQTEVVMLNTNIKPC